MKRYSGIRQIDADTYEINFRPQKGADRIFKRIKAQSVKEASVKMAELITEAQKIKEPEKDQRENLTFDEIYPAFERNILADNLAKKTIYGLKKVYSRIFTEYRLKKCPQITKLSQLDLPFFLEYKAYYAVELKRPRGLRAELGRVVNIMHRLRRLRYCSESIVKDLREIKIPERVKKDYPEITDSNIKAFLARIKSERPDFYGPVYFMVRTGRRVEETTLIERKDIVWNGIKPVKVNIRAEITKMRRNAPLS